MAINAAREAAAAVTDSYKNLFFVFLFSFYVLGQPVAPDVYCTLFVISDVGEVNL